MLRRSWPPTSTANNKHNNSNGGLQCWWWWLPSSLSLTGHGTALSFSYVALPLSLSHTHTHRHMRSSTCAPNWFWGRKLARLSSALALLVHTNCWCSRPEAGWACASFFFVSWFVSTFGADGWSVGTLSKAQLKKQTSLCICSIFCFQLIINCRKIQNKCKWMNTKWNELAKRHVKCVKLQWKVQIKFYWFSSSTEANERRRSSSNSTKV